MNVELKTKAKEYQKKKQALGLLHLFLTPALLFLLIRLPLASGFRDFSETLSANELVSTAVFFSLLSLFLLLFDLPFAWYSGFHLEHRYDLSNQNFQNWLSDFFKKISLSFAFSLILIEGLYALIRNFPDQWWLYAWAAYAAVTYAVGKIFPVFIVPIFYKYGKVDDETLRQKILNLANRFQLPVENVYSLNLSKTTKKANAAFMGIGKTKRVVLSDTLISNFTHEEIETVVAHELGHFKHRDIFKMLGFGLAASLTMFWIVFQLLDPLCEKFGFEGPSDLASMPLLFLMGYLFSVVLMPLQNGFSRAMERAADRFALTVCRNRTAFISCMSKLGTLNLADPDPNPVYEWFFYDHPAIEKRIRFARNAAI